MRSTFCFGIVVSVVCNPLLFAESNPSSPEQKLQPPATSTNKGEQSTAVSRPKPAFRFNDLSASSAIQRAARAASVNDAHPIAALDVLSDTMGVDFRPYLQVVVKRVRQNWYTLIPEDARPPILKKGKVAIEFTILKDGTISGMKLAEGGSSGDSAMDRAAWGGIGASNPFPALPSEFAGQYLALRFHFLYNPDKANLDVVPTSQFAKSAVTVSISPRRAQVTANSQQTFSAIVIGTSNRAVIWSVIELDCSGSGEQCGTISPSGLYIAPQQVHSPVFVKVKAVSEAASDSYDSVTVRVSPGGSAQAATHPSPSP